MKKTCPYCGKTFEALVPWAVYDSNACKQADYRNRKAQEQPQTKPSQQPQKSGKV